MKEKQLVSSGTPIGIQQQIRSNAAELYLTCGI